MQVYNIKKSLNISQYKITKIVLDTDNEIHIRLESYKRKPFICSNCGQVHKTIYHGTEESVVIDLPFFDKKTYLQVVKRRHLCPQDNRIHIEQAS